MLRNTMNLGVMSSQQIFSELKAQEFDFNRMKNTKKASSEESESSEKGAALKARIKEPESLDLNHHQNRENHQKITCHNPKLK